MDCYKCKVEIDNGVRYENITCIVFSDNIGKVYTILNDNLIKHSDECIENVYIEKIEPKEGLFIHLN